MRILYIAPYVPNQIRVRPYQLIRSLVAGGHDLTLLAVWAEPSEREDVAALRSMGVNVAALHLPRWRSLTNSMRAIGSATPFQAVFCEHSGLYGLLDRMIDEQQPQVIHVEHLRGARYGLHASNHLAASTQKPRQRPAARAPVIWDSVDCISYLFEQAAQQSRSIKGRLMTRLDLQRTRGYEGWLVHQFDHVLVTSATDKVALERLATARQLDTPGGPDGVDNPSPAPNVSVLPNGVDLEHFKPTGNRRDPGRIVFTGKMSYHANVTAAVRLVEEIMPHVWTRRPDAEAWIVGKDPAAEVRRLAAKNSDGNGNRRVVVTGTVPDIVPYLQQAAVAVAPIEYGAGIQNKVLEAMACGAAVVASPQAVSALQTKDGTDLLVANGAVAYADHITDLLENAAKRTALGEAGRRYVVRHHSWHSIAAQLEGIYGDAIRRLQSAQSERNVVLTS